METVLANLLLAHPALAAMVGANVDWDEAPQGADAPLIVMFVISTLPSHTYQGTVKLVGNRVQIDCRGNTRKEARQLAALVDERLDGFRGEFGGVAFGGAFKQSHRTRARTEASGWFTASLDYLIWSAAD